jgi:hypothetical protein
LWFLVLGIPQVGYLTTFDEWIFTMYTVLAVCVVLHQIVIVLKRKTTKVPLRGAAIRSIEFMGRVFAGPLACIYYMVTFMDPTIEVYAVYLTIILGFVTFIAIRDFGGLKKSLIEASNSIQDKLDEHKKTTRFELFVMNLVSLKTLSTSESHYKARLSRRARSEYAAKRTIEMINKEKKDLQRDSDDED